MSKSSKKKNEKVSKPQENNKDPNDTGNFTLPSEATRSIDPVNASKLWVEALKREKVAKKTWLGI